MKTKSCSISNFAIHSLIKKSFLSIQILLVAMSQGQFKKKVVEPGKTTFHYFISTFHALSKYLNKIVRATKLTALERLQVYPAGT